MYALHLSSYQNDIFASLIIFEPSKTFIKEVKSAFNKMGKFLFESKIIYPLGKKDSDEVTFHKCSRRVSGHFFEGKCKQFSIFENFTHLGIHILADSHKLIQLFFRSFNFPANGPPVIGQTDFLKTRPYKFHGYLSRTQNRECKSMNAIIPSYVDIDFIQKNNLAEITVQKSSDSSPLPEGLLADEKRGDIKDFNFFVSTKFHFGNNSWTWTNGGQINANEWYNIQGRTPVYPITPIKVFL